MCVAQSGGVGDGGERGEAIRMALEGKLSGSWGALSGRCFGELAA